MAAEVMTKLPACIDEAEVRRILGEAIQQPLNIVLLQEVKTMAMQFFVHDKQFKIICKYPSDLPVQRAARRYKEILDRVGQGHSGPRGYVSRSR